MDEDNSKNQGATSTPEGPTINVFKAPPFCSQDPSLWFTIIECNFKANRITTSLAKFSHATSLLPPDVLSQVSDVIAKAILSAQPYEDLKSAIISRLETSITTRLQELLSKEELGNEKPTGLLRRMKKLLGDKNNQFDEALFLQLFYQRLPPTIQRNLFTVKSKLSIDELAELADEFLQSIPGDQVASVNTGPTISKIQSPPDAQLAELISKLTLQVNSLKNEVATLQIQVNNLSKQSRHSRSHSRRRFQPRSPSAGRNICFYHKNFGVKARKCDPPCTFNGSSLNNEGEH